MSIVRHKSRAGAMEGDGGTEVRMKVKEAATFPRALLHPA